MRKRTLIEWQDKQDGELLTHLDQFKARARGRRLKELARLGMAAERAGLRTIQTADGSLRLDGYAQVSVANNSGPVRVPVVAAPLPSALLPSRTEDHAQGLESLMGALGIG